MKLKTISLFLLLIYIAIGCNLTNPISPGDLSTAHADLEGTQNCTSCHVLGKWVTDSKCLECHKEINALVENNKGYHSSKEVTSKKCLECHNEHHGRDFELVHFDSTNFDHQLTGYLLEDKHSETNCKACHQKSNIEDDSLKVRENTFLGLQNACLSCHEDYHQESLGENCIDCHNFKGFDQVEKFDHQKTDYPLLGKHNEVDCEKCHLKEIKNGKDFQNFSGIKFNQCEDCHKDKHEGKFSQTCDECHKVESFKEIKNISLFNHDLTGYKLEGKHTSVDCYDCHKKSCTVALPNQNCYDCHDDYHKGDFTKNNEQKDCKECHSIEGFEVPSYSIEQHNESQFALTGAHIATPCLSCHKKNDEWRFKKMGSECVDCHDNIHKEYISAKYYPQENCESCHNTGKWSTVKFDHSKTDFALEGAHKNKTCKDCHYKEKDIKQIHVFKTLDKSCVTCHNDVHYKQFEKNGATNCKSCHNLNDWTIAKFNHDNTQFKLDGRHKNVACNECHKTVTENNNKFTQYKIKSFTCADCHQ